MLVSEAFLPRIKIAKDIPKTKTCLYN